jgi:hypothetical protein
MANQTIAFALKTPSEIKKPVFILDFRFHYEAPVPVHQQTRNRVSFIHLFASQFEFEQNFPCQKGAWKREQQYYASPTMKVRDLGSMQASECVKPTTQDHDSTFES